MPNITVLDKNTINQIAAGEVVERPASVVKELIENAIDAGATAITAEIKEGGIRFLRITDNGSGIDKDEVSLAFLRHSTSKIRTVEDLLTTKSLGFRGEALSSIASISQVELVTKTREAFTGIRFLIEGGEEKGTFEIGCPEGTTFLIKNLFYNTPARRKFLKSAMTEAGYVSDLMERISISHPEISFKFINNGKTILHTSGNKNLKDLIYQVYGRDISRELLEVNLEKEYMSVNGLIGKPVISRGNRNYENYFINGRYIRSSIISKAIEEAYQGYSMQHKYPFTVLNFLIPTELIDVNVHPTKMEIRFAESDAVYQLAYAAVRDTLSGKNMIRQVNLSEENASKISYQDIPEPFEEKRIQKQFGKKENDNSSSRGQVRERALKAREAEINRMQKTPLFSNEILPFERDFKPNKNEPDIVAADTEIMKLKNASDQLESIKMEEQKIKGTEQNQEQVRENSVYTANPMKDVISNIEQEELDVFLTKEQQKNHKIIGQLFSTYWMVELNNYLYIVDQHAAHEKVLYESTMKKRKDKEYLSQLVSPPIILSLNLREEAALKEHMEILCLLGFEIEAFGGKEYCISAVPADMYGIGGQELFIELLDNLVEEAPKGTPDIILEKIAFLSCRAAVKGNRKLTVEEAQALIDQLLTLKDPFHCPHGRPIILSMSKQEIEKKFKRIV